MCNTTSLLEMRTYTGVCLRPQSSMMMMMITVDILPDLLELFEKVGLTRFFWFFNERCS